MKQLIINTILDLSFNKNIFLEIKKHFSNKSLKFSGWLGGYKIIKINDKNYKIIPLVFENKIILKETSSNKINIPNYSTKQEAYKKYNSILNDTIK